MSKYYLIDISLRPPLHSKPLRAAKELHNASLAQRMSAQIGRKHEWSSIPAEDGGFDKMKVWNMQRSSSLLRKSTTRSSHRLESNQTYENTHNQTAAIKSIHNNNIKIFNSSHKVGLLEELRVTT